MFFYMAMGAERLKILERIIPHLAASDPVMTMEVLERATPLAPPVALLPNSL